MMFSRGRMAFVPLLTLLGLTLFSGPASAQIPIFNTGVDDSGVKQGSGTDLHYRIVAGTDISTPVNAIIFSLGLPAGPLYVTSPTSNWIWRNNNGLPSPATFTFRTTFDLTGFNPNTASLTGRFAADNGATMQLNGVNVGPFIPVGPFEAFTMFHNILLNTGFGTGINTLDFVVVDTGGVGGLNVDQLVITAQPLGAEAPEPGTLPLMGLGLTGLIIRKCLTKT